MRIADLSLDIGALWLDMWRTIRNVDTRSICAVDMALWDIAGKVANLPVHRLLATYRESAPAYASSAVMPRVEDYAEEALRFRAAGWSAYKIHPHGDPATDVEICAAVKHAVGDSMVLMLDSMWSLVADEKRRAASAISLGVQPLSAKKAILNERQVRVEARRLMINVTLPRIRANQQTRDTKSIAVGIDRRRHDVVVESTPIVPREKNSCAVPCWAQHESVDQIPNVCLPLID